MSSLPSSRRLPLLLGLSALLPLLGVSALTWDAQKVELTANPADKEAVAVFRFVNSGNSSVTIISIVPTCGCTTAELAKRTYAPGESGEIKAVLHIGDRTGLQEKIIQVITDDAPTAPAALTLQVTIPEPFSASSRLLLWRTAEILTEKSIIVTNASPQKIATIEAMPAPAVPAGARIEELEAGTKYRIAVLPASIARAATHSLIFLIRYADQTTQQLPVHVVVK